MRDGAFAARVRSGHQRHRREGGCLHQIARHLAAGAFAQAQTVAGVAPVAGRPVFLTGRGVGQQLLLAFRVVRKTAAGQHHAAARLHMQGALRCVQHRAGHPAVVLEQARGGAVGQNLPALVQQRTGQTGHQRIAVDQLRAAPVHQQVAPVAQHFFRDVPEGRWLVHRVQKVPQLRARGDAHAPQRGLVQRGFEVMQALAQAAAIEGRGADRAATGGRIGRVTVKVGNGVAVDELQRRLAAEEIHHARAVVQKAAGAGFVELLAKFVAQIGQGFVDGLMDAGLDRERVAGNPHPAARPGGGAAVVRVLLGHDDVQPQVRGRHSGRQAAGSRADDQQVAVQCAVRAHAQTA